VDRAEGSNRLHW